MAHPRRYAVDPSLQGHTPSFQPQQYQQHQQYDGGVGQQASAPTYDSAYQPNQPQKERSYHSDLPPPPDAFQSVSGGVNQGYVASPPPPENHIPQPPHSSGPSLRGPKPRIDASQVPSPIEAAELDQNLYDQEDFETCNTKGLVPLAGTDYRGVDQGNSLPRYIRPTLTHFPSSSALLDTCQLPFGLILQPFAPPRYDEEPIPLIMEFSDGADAEGSASTPAGPPRCQQCRGYINPWCKWVDGGQRWQCNLCQSFTTVDPSYYAHLDVTGVRVDIGNRPELRFGTVDFAAPPAYWAESPSSLLDRGLSHTGDLLASLNDAVVATTGHIPTEKEKSQRQKEKQREEQQLRRPQLIGRVFAIDVSWAAGKAGIIAQVCKSIKTVLYGETAGGDGQASHPTPAGRVAILTYDRSLHFYDLAPERERPHMMMVADLDEPFVPLVNGFLVDPIESRQQIESLLDILPSMFAENPYGEVAVGAVVKGVLSALATQGGQLTIFATGLPNAGPGKLKPREDPLIYGTDKERQLYGPADPFWRNTAEELAEAGVGVDLFLFPERYMDIASVGALASVTGGSVFFHPRFDAMRDGSRVTEELRRITGDDVAYNAAVRVRCSNGLRVQEYTGNFHQRTLTDLDFGNISSQSSFAATLRHDKKLDDRQMAFVQAAVLHTTANGERRVRVMNLSIPVTSHIGNVFRFADFDASLLQVVKEAMAQTTQKSLPDIRRGLTERCVKVLLMYRKHCAAATQPGQLILPEAFKLLPLMTLCLLKSKAIKGGNVASDVRSLYMRALRAMPLTKASMFLYPKMIALHNLPDNVGFAGPKGRLEQPTYIRASYAYMVADGAYMIANGEIAIIWLGSAVSAQILQDLYGVEHLEELDVRITGVPSLETLLSAQVRNILAHYERLLGHSLPVVLARQNVDGTEMEFANMLVEDSNNDALSYTEYLMSVHKSITEELHGNGRSSEGWKAPWS